MDQARDIMAALKNNSGWIVAVWGWLVAHCPTTNELLTLLSTACAVLQLIVLVIKISHRKKGGDDD